MGTYGTRHVQYKPILLLLLDRGPGVASVPAARAVARVTEQASGLAVAVQDTPDTPVLGATDTKVVPGHSWSRTGMVDPAAKEAVPMLPMLTVYVSAACPR